MKRFIFLLLTYLLVISLVACGNDVTPAPLADENLTSKPESLSEYVVYPKQADEFIPNILTITEPPDKIFTASDVNNCKGTVYKFYGLITAFEEASDENSNCDAVRLKTDHGEIYISSLYKRMIVDVPDAECDEIAQVFLLPNVGDWVCMYAEYEGYGDVFNSPYAVLGGLDAVTNAYNLVMSEGEDTEVMSSDNPLLNAEMHGATNGTIRRRYIEIEKSVLKEITEDQYTQFVDTCVRDSGYNWVSIICEDGTGICFVGSLGYVADYGKLDSTGCIIEKIGTIMITDDGYTYEEI